MKNMGKKIRYIAFFIGVCVLLAGCGKKFDASGYTKAVLDVSYKNEIQKYVELTGADEKEADKIFEDNLQNNMDIMLQEFSGYELPDELEEKYRKLFSDMMKQVKYTVAEAKEVENKNFTVDVKVEPMLIFNDTYQELQKQTEDYATQVSNEVMNGAPLPSETDMQTHVFEIYHDILRNYLDQGMKYGDPETITVHVNKDDKNVYTIADEDISKIDGKVTEREVQIFSEGLSIGNDEYAKPSALKILKEGNISEIELTIQEGKFHQVKRMFHAVGMEVIYLKRISMGNLVLDESLKKGEYRRLTEKEVEQLC